jgi:acetylornithine deacetylase/succinyl-diaminopimelate desuccinylase-like protein
MLMIKKIFFTCAAVFFIAVQLFCQDEKISRIRKYVQANQHAVINEFASFLAIPNISSDSADIVRNANFIMQAMDKRNIKNIQLLYPVTSKAFPAVYGEVMVKGATQTLIFYAHYDGQPVTPSQWAKGLEPFKPALYTASLEHGGLAVDFPSTDKLYNPQWRIYARGASDDKAGVMAIINAYEAIIKTGMQPTVNIKFFFEAEEEAGSGHLFEILGEHTALLKSDCWIICDGPVHQSGLKQVLFGARGDAHVNVTVYGSKRPLHSGHYSNWAPNPAMMMAQLLASMKDTSGKVTIKGFYDDVTPLSDAEKKALKEMPAIDDALKKELGFIKPELAGVTLAEAINIPTLNINGMQSANVGKNASNVIPIKAEAVIDLRMVVGNNWQKQQQKVVDHIKAQGYYITNTEPTDEERGNYPKIARINLSDGYNAQKTPMDLPIAKKIVAAVQSTITEKVIQAPTLGGSLPLFVFDQYLKANTITVPLANYDNNQHAENENIRLQNFWNGIETMAALMMMK